MDNQQQRMLELGWLTAAIEGEGTMTMITAAVKSKTGFAIVPTVRVSNTKEAFIRRFEDICRKNGIGVHIGSTSPQGNRQPIWIARVQGLRRVEKLLNLVGPLLTIKREQANLLDEFINYRGTMPFHTPHGTLELAFRDKIQSLNKSGKPSIPAQRLHASPPSLEG